MNITQKQLVLNHLKHNRLGITSAEAFAEYGITRLAAVIFDLREEGHDITTEDIYATNRYGVKVSYARYKLVEEGSEN